VKRNTTTVFLVCLGQKGNKGFGKRLHYFLAQSFANSSQNQACYAPSYLHGHGPLTDNFALLKEASCFSLTWACTKWPSWIPETRINAAKTKSASIIGSSLLIDQANQLIMRSVEHYSPFLQSGLDFNMLTKSEGYSSWFVSEKKWTILDVTMMTKHQPRHSKLL